MADLPYDGAMLWLGVTSSTRSIICLRNTETKTRGTRVLLNIACMIIALLSPASSLDPIVLEIGWTNNKKDLCLREPKSPCSW